MSVNVSDRKTSSVEFDNNYFRLLEDGVNLINKYFGANDNYRDRYQGFIGIISDRILKSLFDMGTHIRIANSIYPKYKSELELRRIEQEKAIGLCYDLLTKYQNAMKILNIKDDKYVKEIQHIQHEINSLKRWRTSDNSRFKNLG